jgi:hypothetical protein
MSINLDQDPEFKQMVEQRMRLLEGIAQCSVNHQELSRRVDQEVSKRELLLEDLKQLEPSFQQKIKEANEAYANSGMAS